MTAAMTLDPSDALSVAENSSEEKLGAWVERQYAKGPPARVILALTVRHGHAQNIAEWDDFEDMDPGKLAMQVAERATEDAKFQNGVARYLAIWYKKGDAVPTAREWITRRGGADDFDGIEGSSEPTAQGVLAQSMHLTDLSLRLSMQQYYQIMTRQADEIMQLRRELSKAFEKHFKIVDMYERMVSEEQERRLELRKAVFEESRKEKVWEQLMMILPLAMKKFGEKKGKAAVEDVAEQALLTNFVSSLSQDQIQSIATKLTPVQMTSFMEFYKKLRDKQVVHIDKDIAKKVAEVEKDAEEIRTP